MTRDRWERPAPHGRRIFTVSELTALVKAHLETTFSDVWVEGEVSNLRCPPSGHLYFSLKDRTGQLRAVCFRSGGRRLKFVPVDGRAVLAKGHLTVYEPRGDYQLIVDYLEPVGLGALQAAFEQLKERLAAEGLFDAARKRPLPALPRRVGIVTSPTGAVIRDMLTVLARRFANLHVVINPTPVQGEGAAARIAEAIDELNALGLADVIIVGRGGGSLEDLWAFNEEAVARAIARSKAPVISAVGHETDVTIADFVADLRAPTPSAAAELVVKTKTELIGRVDHLHQELVRACRLAIERRRDHVRHERRALIDPQRAIEAAIQRADELGERLRNVLPRALQRRWERAAGLLQQCRARSPLELIRSMLQRLGQSRERLGRGMRHQDHLRRVRVEHRLAQLRTLSPLAILSRGYSVARRLSDGRILRSAEGVTPGERVVVLLHEGELRTSVEEARRQRSWPPVEPA
ncbi:MAG TPA: exodeoxyribonuclease VII large subunit [Nitrospiria bacterium]|nr:exodeoxyribonuclease VII large subunit [Nitrospiria bacterium]